jgi:anti-sigma factor RsiW
MLSLYVDGELEAPRLVEMEEHVTGCETCGEEVRLIRAIRGSMKRVVRTPAPDGLRERLQKAMTAEQARADARSQAEDAMFAPIGPAAKVGSWRTVVPLAVAAAFALMWGAARRSQVAFAPPSEVRAGIAGDDLLPELVTEHSQPLPPDATDLKAVHERERLVGVPVHPEAFERAGVHFVGGRVVRLHSQDAMMIEYVTGSAGPADEQHRVGVLIYNPEKLAVGFARLAPRTVGTVEIRVGQERGYNVVARQRAGVGYALVSDMDADKLAAMVNDGR